MRSKLLIVCEIRLYREGLELSLRRRGWLELEGTGAGGSEVLDRVRRFGAGLVLLDMAGRSSLDTLHLLLRDSPDVKVVALGVEESPDTVLGLVEAGAAGYVARDATVEDLLEALQAVSRGEVVCSPRIAGSLVRRVAALASERPAEAPIDVLTERERETLALIERGYSNKQIARTLGVKIPTVKNHVHHVLEKLGVSGRGAAAALAREIRGYREPARPTQQRS
jgi:two-component system, NarL family, nitrate/nitrite response regulator NarL